MLYGKQTLVFKDFRDLQFLGEHEINELEIFRANFTYNNHIFNGEFVFLLGFALPSVTLNFKFMDFDIIDL